MRENLAKVLRELDVLLINDGEVRMLCRRDEPGAGGGEGAWRWGRRRWWSSMASTVRRRSSAIVRLVSDDVSRPFRAPALPLAEVVDPTGAGDSFAGGFYGYLASQPELTPAVFRTAMFYGGVMGSFAVERFGTERLQSGDARGDRRALQAVPGDLAP